MLRCLPKTSAGHAIDSFTPRQKKAMLHSLACRMQSQWARKRKQERDKGSMHKHTKKMRSTTQCSPLGYVTTPLDNHWLQLTQVDLLICTTWQLWKDNHREGRAYPCTRTLMFIGVLYAPWCVSTSKTWTLCLLIIKTNNLQFPHIYVNV